MFTLTELEDTKTVRICRYIAPSHNFTGIMVPCDASWFSHIKFAGSSFRYGVERMITASGTYDYMLVLSEEVLEELHCKLGDELTWTVADRTLNFEKIKS